MPRDTEFEAAFGELVYSELRDRAPQLLDHLLGFQIIDKNDDGTSGVGIAGFQVGNQQMYAPMFFTGGRIKGGNLLYLKDQDLFLPLKENWINYLISRKPQVLGIPLPGGQERNILSPDMSGIVEVPETHYASARWPAWMLKSPGDAKYASIRTLPQMLQKHARAAYTLARNMRDNPEFANTLLRFYDLQDLLPKQAKDGDRMIVNRKEDTVSEPTKQYIQDNSLKAVKVYYTPEDLSEELEVLDGKKKEQLLRGEIVVEDPRTEDETSRVYALDCVRTASNPDETGLYDVLLSNNEFKKLLVILYPRRVGQDYLDKSRTTECLLVDPKSGLARVAFPKDVIVRKKYDKQELKNVYDNASSHSSMRIDKIYIAVDRDLEFTTPFKIKSIITDSAGMTQYEIMSADRLEMLANRTGSTVNSCCSNAVIPGCCGTYTEGPKTLVITNRDTGGIQTSERTTFLPKNIRVIQLQSKVKTEPLGYESSPTRTEDRKIESRVDPGTLTSLFAGVLKAGAVRVDIWRDGPQYLLRDRETHTMTKRAAVDYLLGMGIHGNTAVRMVKEAGDRRHPSRFLVVKSAQGASPVAPGIPEYPMGYDGIMGIPQSLPMEQEIAAPGATYAEPDVDPYNLKPPAIQQKGMLDAAAKTQQKEVFDTAMLGGLVKALDAPALVDEYIGDLILGLDRIGRILFLLYWHPNAFAERYGREDLVNLEDSLDSVFDSLGDVILVLKQQTIEPEPTNEESVPQLPVESV